MKLFERIVELTVGDTQISGLDIAFEIEKDLNPEPNSCSIEIFNLSHENRAVLSKYDRVPVLLKAGYKDSVGLIFCGDMINVRHIKEGATWITKLSSGDGANAIQNARTQKAYVKGTQVKTIIKDLAKDLNLPHNSALKQIESLQTSLEKGHMISGSSLSEINRLLKSHNMSASIQDGELAILKKGEALQKDAIVLDSDNGLLSMPEISSNGEINIKTVILPGLSPGRKVYIDSYYLKSFAIIQSVRFCGDNFGGVWEAEISCTII